MNLKNQNALLAGLAGAVVVTLLNETLRRADEDAPRPGEAWHGRR